MKLALLASCLVACLTLLPIAAVADCGCGNPACNCTGAAASFQLQAAPVPVTRVAPMPATATVSQVEYVAVGPVRVRHTRPARVTYRVR